MKRTSFMFLLGTVVGAVTAYLATARGEEILRKLEELQEQIKESDFPERTKNLLKEISETITQLVTSGEKEMSDEEKRSILEEVEAKIKKLEETIQQKAE